MKTIIKIMLISSLFLTGCAHLQNPPKPTPIDPNMNCKNVPYVWWGRAGKDPSQTDLWKCYDWILKAQALEREEKKLQ